MLECYFYLDHIRCLLFFEYENIRWHWKKHILLPVVIVQADDPGYDEQDAANKVDE